MSTPPLRPCDVLAIGAHPDDVEIAAAGTLLLLARAGHTVSIVDATRGEKGSRGTANDRAAEAAAAARRLGVQDRHNLERPDTGVVADEPTVALVVAVLRAARPRLLLAPHAHDVHPDHVAVATACERAFFLAGLKHFEPQLGAPHRPALFLRYPGNRHVEPTVAVDITAVAADKREVLRCYRSQLHPPDRTNPDRSHLIQGRDVLERAETRDHYTGARIGVATAEPFWHDGPLPLAAAALLPA